jgi:hypothetical protein
MTVQMWGVMNTPREKMVTHVLVQDTQWTVAADWERTKKGWRFTGH